MAKTRKENCTGNRLGLGDIVFVLCCGYIGIITQESRFLCSTFYKVESSSGSGLFLEKELIKLCHEKQI